MDSPERRVEIILRGPMGGGKSVLANTIIGLLALQGIEVTRSDDSVPFLGTRISHPDPMKVTIREETS